MVTLEINSRQRSWSDWRMVGGHELRDVVENWQDLPGQIFAVDGREKILTAITSSVVVDGEYIPSHSHVSLRDKGEISFCGVTATYTCD